MGFPVGLRPHGAWGSRKVTIRLAGASVDNTLKTLRSPPPGIQEGPQNMNDSASAFFVADRLGVQCGQIPPPSCAAGLNGEHPVCPMALQLCNNHRAGTSGAWAGWIWLRGITLTICHPLLRGLPAPRRGKVGRGGRRCGPAGRGHQACSPGRHAAVPFRRPAVAVEPRRIPARR